MRFLPRWLRGGDDELGWDDLVRRIVQAIVALRRYAERGRVAFPPDVVVHIEMADGIEVIRGFLDKPELDAEVCAAVANACDCDVADLPDREYLITTAAATRVHATEGAPRVWELHIEGGDLSGRVIVFPRGRELRFGRGAFHGADQNMRNDLVVCEKSEFVSRRAGRMAITGAKLEVESLDQGDGLVVHRPTGEAIRPARTARGRVLARPGDMIELADGRGASIRLTLARKSIEGDRGRDYT